MKLAHIHVQNYKSLCDVEVELSQFVCVIGQNNAGKSTLIQAMLLFLEGRKLSQTQFYDAHRDIVIKMTLTEVNESDLALVVNVDHRERIRASLTDCTIMLVRRYGTDGTSKLRWITMIPEEDRLQEDQIEALLRGKKPGAQLATEVLERFPEFAEKVGAKTNQSQIKGFINDLIRDLPAELKVEREKDLPTGLDASFKALFPEPIYIPAVKDFSDDIKTKDSSSFGKLLGILLSAMTPALSETEIAFQALKKKLNLVFDSDGQISDERLSIVKLIENTVQGFVQENFPTIKLELQIPPPDLKTVLSSARVLIDDGVQGELDSKGDGLKRSVAFAILRSIASLKRHPEITSADKRPNPGFLLLFEEPELYLHPNAQRILFDALAEISRTEQVVVSTHSPLFFSAETTGTFVKVVKKSPRDEREKPFGETLSIKLNNFDKRSRFQLINFSINNSAFFSNSILLVEGDSDHIVFPHLARTLNADWCIDRKGVSVCQINGKYNIGRYRKFFRAFDVRVIVLADLDCLLEGFDQLGTPPECESVRHKLIHALDEELHATSGLGTGSEAQAPMSKFVDREFLNTIKNARGIPQKAVKDLYASVSKKSQWDILANTMIRFMAGDATPEELNQVGNAFFDKQIMSSRRSILEKSTDETIIALKHDLLIELRRHDIFVLSKGSLESYYPSDIASDNKINRAIALCKSVTQRDHVLSLCEEIPVSSERDIENELEWVFSKIFTTSSNPTFA